MGYSFRVHGRSVAVWFAICALALAGAGCSKQRAELSLKKANTNIKQAREWNAGNYPESKGPLEAAENAAKTAQGSLDGKQYAPALTQAQDAVKQSQDALANAKTRFADQKREEARKAVQVARINDGPSENDTLFKKAEASLQTAEEKYNKQKYEDAINAAVESIEAVEQLLAHLKNTSQNKLDDLRTKLKELEAQDANRFMPQAIIKAGEAINAVEKKINTDRDYKQAILMAGTAITDAEAGIIETKKKKSNLELQTLESKISEAIAEEAPIYAPDKLRTCQESFEDILRSYYENQFDTVLGSALNLKPAVDELITITRIEATKDKIATVRKAIDNLNDEDVEKYLPGRVQVMQKLVVEAQDLFNNNDYDSAKEKASQGLIEQDRIIAAFDALAEKTIQDGDAAFNAARQTYEKMTTFFAQRQGAPVIDQRIESRRQTEAANLGAQRDAASQQLQFANFNRNQKHFKKAIEQAKNVQAVSDIVVNGTFRIVAEHALLSIQDEVSELERQGAREQAGRQLSQVQSLVEETQRLIGENHNREAAEMTAKARAYIENVKQMLAKRAVEERNRADQLIRRLEGGGGPSSSPAGGYREAPGGSDLNNKEMMFDEAGRAAFDNASARVVAQTTKGTAWDGNTGPTGNLPAFSNQGLPNGTMMHDQSPAPGSALTGKTGAPTGAIVGTRPEPVVSTRNQAGAASSEASYEPVTGPGPFVVRPATPSGGATGDAAGGTDFAATAGEDSAEGIRAQIEDILLDDQRVLDIQKYQPSAIGQAREKLQESSNALIAQDYVKALVTAREAQRIILEAEMKAARSAARANLQAAADRINLSEAAGSIMFAPAQLTEAINLYEQAQKFLDRGEYLKARDVSARAVIAADDARLYNVNKARDLTGLSTRYGGWRAAHPLIVDAEQSAARAESLLAQPDTAAQGQEAAKQAVTLAQMALDHSRDFTFQERIDNIYKALNVALRAGANYFNVEEVKRLIAEISAARDEYCTRNFDAVELRLKDIEAGLARIIETTPLVLEQNLIENTAKLNALVEAGAENYMPQEIDDVKTLMNRSVVDFRKNDYHSSYTNIKNAIALVDRIEARLQEQVYFDAVTELFSQLDQAFNKFDGILGYDSTFLKKLVSAHHGQPAAINITAGRMNPNDFKDTITDIYLRAIHLKPPKSQEGTHEQVLLAIKYARVASTNFQKLYIMDQLTKPDAFEVIETAYNQIRQSRQLRAEVQLRLIDPQARTKVIRAEKIVND